MRNRCKRCGTFIKDEEPCKFCDSEGTPTQCPHCGKIFQKKYAKTPHRRFCSDRCCRLAGHYRKYRSNPLYRMERIGIDRSRKWREDKDKKGLCTRCGGPRNRTLENGKTGKVCRDCYDEVKGRW